MTGPRSLPTAQTGQHHPTLRLRSIALLLVLEGLAATSKAVAAEKQYGPGVTDSEITIGQTMPYSGPASAYGTLGKAEAAYFEKVNREGGINGRKIRLVSLDDGYSPPKTVEQTRRLVEQQQVLLIFSSVGTPTNSAVHKYLNSNRVPHLLVASGAAKWGDPQHFPWTMGSNPNYQFEARVYAKYILKQYQTQRLAFCIKTMTSGKIT